MSQKFQTIHDNHLIDIGFVGHQCEINIIVLGSEKKSNKYKAKFVFQLGNHESVLGQFDTKQEFHKFMSQQANYIIDYTNKLLLLRWKIVGHGYKKRIQHKISLDSQQLTEKQSLQCEIILLRRKLEEYQKADQKRVKRNIRRRKSKKENGENIADSAYLGHEKYDSENSQSQNKQIKSKSIELNRLRNNSRQKNITTKQKIIKKNEIISQRKKQEQQNHEKLIFSNKLISDDYGDPSDSQSPFEKQSQPENVSEDEGCKDQGPMKKINNQPEIQSEKNLLKSQIIQNLNQQKVTLNGKQGNQVKAKQLKQKEVIQQSKINDDQKNDAKKIKQEQPENYHNINVVTQEHYKKAKVGDKIRIDFQNGDYYFGHLKNNVFHGYGLYYSKINGTYQGEWKAGRANGYGVTVDADGNKHQGFYKNDLRHGKGKDWYPNGQRYEGEFVESNKQGFGTYFYINGDLYEGQWKKDKCDGRGKQIYTNGSYYEGQWKQDEKHGPGILYSSFGQLKQIYRMGQLVSEENISQKINQNKS